MIEVMAKVAYDNGCNVLHKNNVSIYYSLVITSTYSEVHILNDIELLDLSSITRHWRPRRLSHLGGAE